MKMNFLGNTDPYMNCPEYETENFRLRLIQKDDTEQLLKCYSDMDAVRFMNADNCTDDFYYPTLERMQQAVDFWIYSYETRWFIRFSVIDRMKEMMIGTIEIFGGGDGVLRVDVASEYEKEKYLGELFQLAKKEFFTLFDNTRIVTKAIPEAIERRNTLEGCGWRFIDTFRTYKDYYEIVE